MEEIVDTAKKVGVCERFQETDLREIKELKDTTAEK